MILRRPAPSTEAGSSETPAKRQNTPQDGPVSVGRIAFVAVGAPGWIAGTIYVRNLLRAFALLPASERPETIVLHGQGGRVQSAKEVAALADRAASYAYRDSTTAWRRLAGCVRAVATGQPPRGLIATAQATGAECIFPLLQPLPSPAAVPWIGWVPDFQFRHFPGNWPARVLKAYQANIVALIARAPHLVVSSEAALRDLRAWQPRAPDTVTVLPFANPPEDAWYQPDPTEVAARHDLPDKFLIFPSQFWIHKNHATAFQAIRLLRDRGIGDICLVSTGQTSDSRNPHHFPELQAWLEKQRLTGNVRILGLLPRTEMIQLMRRAVAVIQPSLFEGWSALVEDARTLGKRLYLSDIPVHREQDPPMATYFPPKDGAALADLLAADWAALAPGPRPAAEARARSLAGARAQEYARRFLQLVRVTRERA